MRDFTSFSIALATLLFGAACTSELERRETATAELVSSRPRVLIANQNGFYDGPGRCNADRGEVASISGHWFLQQNCESEAECAADQPAFQQFVLRTQADVECRLSKFLKDNALEFGAKKRKPGQGCRDAAGAWGQACPLENGVPECWSAPDLTRTIIIDIEKPHPSNIGQYPGAVDAYKTRVRAARAAFPRAKLGLYGTLVPDERGDPNDPKYEARRIALVKAGFNGLYDDLDYLVPVLYPRFGCDDPAGAVCDPDAPVPRPWCDRAFDKIEEYTELGVYGSRSLTPNLPLLPLITFRVHNGNSCFGKDAVAGSHLLVGHRLLLDMWLDDAFEATLGAQLDVLGAAEVTEAVLWTGGDDQHVFSAPNDGPRPEGWTLSDYTSRLCPIGQ
jgi:hypothetical protein